MVGAKNKENCCFLTFIAEYSQLFSKHTVSCGIFPEKYDNIPIVRVKLVRGITKTEEEMG